MMNYGYYPQASYCKDKLYMKINGVGAVKAEADTAIVYIGVITEDKSLEKAQKENAVKSNSVLDNLSKMGVDKKSISTFSYNITPQYDYIEGKQVFRGYKVTNIFLVTIKDLSKIGEIVDSSVLAGANYVENITFTISDPSKYYATALKLAVKDAIEKAQEIASTIKVNLYETPVKILEESYSTIPEGSAMKIATAATTILPSQINITARIEALFLYN